MTLQKFFENNKMLNLTQFAGSIGINPSLFRQYATGRKMSKLQAEKIVKGLNELGENLKRIKLTT